jgi:predicted transcriptional regulator
MKPGRHTQVSIPPALVAAVQAAADEEHRPTAAVVQEALEVYLEGRRWRLHSERELARARELGLPGDDVPLTDEHRPAIDEYRQVLREKIAAGVRSLRQGRVTDGEAFMAKIDAELAELERQGR